VVVAVVVAVIAPVAVEAQPWAVARGVLLASNVDSQRLAVHPVPLHAVECLCCLLLVGK
jgi:hypothetical protein